ncbi:hypothetical protein PFISCL1PPCAC_10090 [Pristionchus fissidentatus]|uniref:Uncharacterized protein n=1 Tax=Pristionchus fissidentatus TaxID=1538716 RepID=A0AAV5VL29_9BILA|nr:hypothetical protein PFISCL1PPCAC_10090 [Pristionchus fissidentatus]
MNKPSISARIDFTESVSGKADRRTAPVGLAIGILEEFHTGLELIREEEVPLECVEIGEGKLTSGEGHHGSDQRFVLELQNISILHSTILEPDLDLSLTEHQGVRYFDASLPRQILVEMEFLLQFQYLIPSVRRSLPLLASFRTASITVNSRHPGVDGRPRRSLLLPRITTEIVFLILPIAIAVLSLQHLVGCCKLLLHHTCCTCCRCCRIEGSCSCRVVEEGGGGRGWEGVG